MLGYAMYAPKHVLKTGMLVNNSQCNSVLAVDYFYKFYWTPQSQSGCVMECFILCVFIIHIFFNQLIARGSHQYKLMHFCFYRYGFRYWEPNTEFSAGMLRLICFSSCCKMHSVMSRSVTEL